MNSESFMKLLQLSISPIALISGAGLLLLSITNRLGRSLDRSRIVIMAMHTNHNPAAEEQLKILVKRSALLRNSVFFMGFGIFISALMILTLFLKIFMNWACDAAILVLLFFNVSSLCISMVFFLWDVSLALNAIRIEADKFLD